MRHIPPRYYLDFVNNTILYAIWQVEIDRKYSMIFAGVIIGLIILAAIAYIALDKKSSFPVRLASLGAIAIMFITVIICIIVISSDKTVPVDPSMLIVGAPTEVQEKKNNSFTIIFSIVLMVALFVFIAVMAMKEHKKNLPKKNEIDLSDSSPISNW
jgi:ABC-type Fe3+-siderophore transport system permease subunit